MNKKLLIALTALAVIAVVATAWLALKNADFLQKPAAQNEKAATPLVVASGAPIGLIGTVVALGTSTLTIEGQPPGNTAPIRLEVLVDANTNLFKVGPAPSYATSTAAFADIKMGVLLNIEAAGASAEGALRHAERIIIPPLE